MNLLELYKTTKEIITTIETFNIDPSKIKVCLLDSRDGIESLPEARGIMLQPEKGDSPVFAITYDYE